ncbi:hypothetical protein VP01_4027g2, partial [Puccinia sorghi]
MFRGSLIFLKLNFLYFDKLRKPTTIDVQRRLLRPNCLKANKNLDNHLLVLIRDHASAECPKNSAPTQASTSQHSATAPPCPTFSINSATLEEAAVAHQNNIDPTVQSITAHSVNPEVTQEEMDWLMQNGARLFGLDSCASHTITNDLSLLFDCVKLLKPIPLNVATNATNSYVTTVGKMILTNWLGSIIINNVYFSPDATCTLLSADCLWLGGGRITVNDHGNAAVRFASGFNFQSFSICC